MLEGLRTVGRPALLLLSLAVVPACSGSRDRQAAGGTPPDTACLSLLRKAGVSFTSPGEVRGVRTPVVIRGPIQGVRLLPRGRREPVMDCALARGLLEAGPVLRGLDVDGLEYSAAYDYRPRRDSTQLSAHSHGLAIDVHAVRSGSRRDDIATHFEKGVGDWERLRPGPGALAACIGKPATDAGRRLRTLTCRLKLHTSFRVLVTPDDNADHRDHLHLEVYPDVELEPAASSATERSR
jgi:hypothetical protein